MTTPPALLFDLDGTLIDSVYQHVLAWQEALTAFGIDLAVWTIHRRIGMSGGLFVNALLRETGGALSAEQVRDSSWLHAEAYRRRRDTRATAARRPRPARAPARDAGRAVGHRHQRARRHSARPPLALLGLPGRARRSSPATRCAHAKPDPDLFLAAADRSAWRSPTAIVVGDSIWDLLAARRAGALGVGLLSGGYGREELERAGAYRVYADPADLLDHLDEVGVRRD